MRYGNWAASVNHDVELQAQVDEAAGWPSGRDQRRLLQRKPKQPQ